MLCGRLTRMTGEDVPLFCIWGLVPGCSMVVPPTLLPWFPHLPPASTSDEAYCLGGWRIV